MCGWTARVQQVTARRHVRLQERGSDLERRCSRDAAAACADAGADAGAGVCEGQTSLPANERLNESKEQEKERRARDEGTSFTGRDFLSACLSLSHVVSLVSSPSRAGMRHACVPCDR